MSKKVKINISDNLRNVLEKISTESIIAKKLLSNLIDEDNINNDDRIDFLSISSTDVCKISYLTEDRKEYILKNEGDVWNSSRRFEIKPGSFVSRLFNIDNTTFNNKDVENFSNLYKLEVQSNLYEFVLLDHNHIKYAYNEENYENDRSSLGSSCMKYNSSSKYFGIYEHPENNVNILVLKRKDTGKVCGRALIWNTQEVGMFMDRIYTNNDDKLSTLFKRWAIENKAHYRKKQNWQDSFEIVDLDNNVKKQRISIKLDKFNFDLYPYLDTFKFLDLDNGILYNMLPDNYEEIDIITLASPDGDYGDKYYFKLCSIKNRYYYYGDVVQLEYKDNIDVNDELVNYSELNNCYILKTDSIYDGNLRTYIFNDELSHLNKFDKNKNTEKQKDECTDNVDCDEIEIDDTDDVVDIPTFTYYNLDF